jgi:transcriptional regulator with XRE-family HTH domain
MPHSAAVSALELGVRLKKHREDRRLAVAAVAKDLKLHQGNLTSAENGRKKITETNLARLGAYYELDAQEISDLQALRIAAERTEWYHEYAWLFGDDFQRYLGLEAGAASLALYHNALVFGMLQTEAYATAVIRSGAACFRMSEVEPRKEVRLARQKRLTGPGAMRLNALFGEAVLRQEVGGRDVMREQLEHLAQMAAEPNIEIRILPFSVGAYPAVGGPYSIMSFDSEWLPDIVWQELMTQTLSVDRPRPVTDYSFALRETFTMAMSADDSLDLIWEVAKEMT